MTVVTEKKGIGFATAGNFVPFFSEYFLSN